MYRTRRSRRKLSENTHKNIAALFIILAFAVILFFVSAIGEFVAKNVFLPVFGTKATPVPTEKPDANTTATRGIQVPGISGFAISLGAYSTEETAANAAQTAIARGGAGYLMQGKGASGEATRLVLAAAFAAKADAENVKNNLKAEYNDVAVLEVAGKGVTFNVTAPNKTLDLIEESFSLYIAMYTDLAAKSVQVDKAEVTPAAYKRLCEEWKGKLGEKRQALVEAGAEKNVILSGYLDVLDGADKGLSKIIGAADTSALDFSAKIKYNYIECLMSYKAYIDAIGA